MRRGKHHAHKLQKACAKYGFEKLQHTVLEVCNREVLKDLEQKYLDIYKPEYNTSRDARTPMRDSSVLAKRQTPEAREKARRQALDSGAVTNLQTPRAIARRAAAMATPEYILNASRNAKIRKAHENLHTPEARQKSLTASRSDDARALAFKRNEHLMRPVKCITTGILYTSGKNAGRTLGIHPSSISKAAVTGHKAGGHYWVFAEVDMVI